MGSAHGGGPAVAGRRGVSARRGVSEPQGVSGRSGVGERREGEHRGVSGRREASRCGTLLVLLCASTSPGGLQGQVPGTVEASPQITIGASATDPNDQLGRVLSALRLPDGGVAILDGLPASLRVYGADGRFRRQIGRVGEGPGEFTSPQSMTLVGSRLHVLEENGRINVFDLDGELVSTRRVQVGGLMEERFNDRPGGVLPDGRVLVRGPERMFGRVRGEYRQSEALALLSPNDQLTRLGVFAADSGRTDSGDVPVPRPYSPSVGLLMAPHPDGLVLLDPRGTLRVIQLDGGELLNVRLSLPSEPVRPADLEEARESMLEFVTGANDQRVVSEWFDGRPRAETAPGARSILVDSEGLIWVELWRREGDRSRWLVLGPDGQVRDELGTPDGLRLIQIGSDWVMGVWRDPFGVAQLRVHRLNRPS